MYMAVSTPPHAKTLAMLLQPMLLKQSKVRITATYSSQADSIPQSSVRKPKTPANQLSADEGGVSTPCGVVRLGGVTVYLPQGVA